MTRRDEVIIGELHKICAAMQDERRIDSALALKLTGEAARYRQGRVDAFTAAIRALNERMAEIYED